jgi:hypothetical protein
MVQARLRCYPFREAVSSAEKVKRERNGERENETKATFEGERKYHELS